jgi:hypothetical protein
MIVGKSVELTVIFYLIQNIFQVVYDLSLIIFIQKISNLVFHQVNLIHLNIDIISIRYLDAGTKTCNNRPGSLHYETRDANAYASWGVDYLKYENCFDDGTKPEVRFPPMRDALNATGRPIFFSIRGKSRT